jgi:hypothetical protein
MKKPNKQLPMRSEKWCNICGNLVLVYQVIDNAPVCYNCVPEQKLSKKIPNDILSHPKGWSILN